VDALSGDATGDELAFLARAMGAELANRDQARRVRLREKAALPAVKGFDGFDWSHVTLPPALSHDDVTSGAFIQAKQNLVLCGPVGAGKTHLATAIGMAACSQGAQTRFHTVFDLLAPRV
jgi:DNA replication protein DnaC